jgi:hypothetical protein
LTCGLSVATVKWDEIKELDAIVSLCDTKEKFLEAIKRNEHKEIDLSKYLWSGRLESINNTSFSLHSQAGALECRETRESLNGDICLINYY